MDGDDVWMRQPGDRAALAHQPLAGLPDRRPVQELDRDASIELRIPRCVDNTHAAGTERRENLIATELLTGMERARGAAAKRICVGKCRRVRRRAAVTLHATGRGRREPDQQPTAGALREMHLDRLCRGAIAQVAEHRGLVETDAHRASTGHGRIVRGPSQAGNLSAPACYADQG